MICSDLYEGSWCPDQILPGDAQLFPLSRAHGGREAGQKGPGFLSGGTLCPDLRQPLLK